MITTSPYPHGGSVSEQLPFFERIGQNQSFHTWRRSYSIVTQFHPSSLYNIPITHHSVVENFSSLHLSIFFVFDSTAFTTDYEQTEQENEEKCGGTYLEHSHFKHISQFEGIVCFRGC